MMKVISLISIAFVMIGCENRWYFYSPNKEECITFITHENDPFVYYVVPGKYKGRTKPKKNFLTIRWSEDHSFAVNWSAKKYRFAYPLVVENDLDTTLVDFSYTLRRDETVMINGESWYNLPEVEGFALPYIMRGSYLDERKEMNDAFKSFSADDIKESK